MYDEEKDEKAVKPDFEAHKIEKSAVLPCFSEDFCAALDINTVPSYIIDPDTFEVIYANKALMARVPCNPIGGYCYEVIADHSELCSKCPAMKLYHTGESATMETTTPDGFNLLIYPSPVHWRDRFFVQLSCIDISKQKQLERELKLKNEEYSALVRQSITGVMRYDIAKNTAVVNVDRNLDRVEEYTVNNYAEVVMRSGLIEPKSYETALSILNDIRNGMPSRGYNIHLMLENKGLRWCHIEYMLVKDHKGKPSRAIVSFYDNTEQREKEIAYQNWNARLNALIDENTSYMEINLTADTIEAVGRLNSWEQVADGRTFTSFIYKTLDTGIYEEDQLIFAKFFHRERLMGQFYAGNSKSSLEYRSMVDGNPKWFRAEINMAESPINDDIKATVLFKNVDAEVSEKNLLAHKAETDVMTGIYNHATAEELIQQVLSQNTGESCCFLIIDLDDLRDINSTLGHPEGDRALKAIADTMVSVFGKRHILGRVGGDEFVALLRDINDNKQLNALVEGFRESLKYMKIGPDNSKAVQVSIGGALGIVGNTTFKELYEQADLALYYTKATGKNAFNLYVPELKNRKFNYKPRNTATLTKWDWYETADFKRLMSAMSACFPLVVCANLTTNNYYMMEYITFATQSSKESGSFEQLIAEAGGAYHPDDREGFIHTFDRKYLLKTFAEGNTTVEYTGRQIGDDGIYRNVHTIAFITQDETSGDICEISFSHVTPNETSDGIDKLKVYLA